MKFTRRAFTRTIGLVVAGAAVLGRSLRTGITPAAAASDTPPWESPDTRRLIACGRQQGKTLLVQAYLKYRGVA